MGGAITLTDADGKIVETALLALGREKFIADGIGNMRHSFMAEQVKRSIHHAG
jgi:hypothetical protein